MDLFMLDPLFRNTPKPQPRRQPDPSAPTRQTVLFSGLDCIPGQLDLFATDGEIED